jgi:hypothetical protein
MNGLTLLSSFFVLRALFIRRLRHSHSIVHGYWLRIILINFQRAFNC